MISFASLSPNPLVFEPISSMNSVYYDPANGQVFTLRARGAMGVNVKSLESRKTSNFRICDKGEVLSIKFDPNCTVLSLQRKRNCVDFINFENGRPEDIEYSQTCKKTASSIIGFIWSSDNEIIFVTNEGFELYQGFVTKCSSFEVPEEEILSPSSTSTSAASDDLKKLQQKNCLLANLYVLLLKSLTSGYFFPLVFCLQRSNDALGNHLYDVPALSLEPETEFHTPLCILSFIHQI
ncbi:hypothetical protein EGR_06587 [Echinococcus granulosus]|uniref:Regulator of MON1-CCZ1 complex N-terminal domain-containing protein n=1 Tax=Echinococcus granulosus TaxID=6210 RepID=W6UBV3_ECHGR|nr:hypothetical protein EGR_06587 [Echinococcus granulosus]EUB58600.1 hypothetical protein EGR_06587 [Echinococcus granulosus]